MKRHSYIILYLYFFLCLFYKTKEWKIIEWDARACPNGTRGHVWMGRAGMSEWDERAGVSEWDERAGVSEWDWRVGGRVWMGRAGVSELGRVGVSEWDGRACLNGMGGGGGRVWIRKGGRVKKPKPK